MIFVVVVRERTKVQKLAKKISIDKLMQDVFYLNNQIKGLQFLMEQKKSIFKKYFQQTGHTSVANDDISIYTQERTKINYNVNKLKKEKPEIAKKILTKKVEVTDGKKLLSLLKEYGVSKQEVKACLNVYAEVDEAKLTKLYENGTITVDDLSGYYDATSKLSIAVKVKNDGDLKM